MTIPVYYGKTGIWEGDPRFFGFFFCLPLFFFFLEVDDAKVWKVKHHIKEDKSGLLDPATF